jgi:hypothetical protein
MPPLLKVLFDGKLRSFQMHLRTGEKIQRHGERLFRSIQIERSIVNRDCDGVNDLAASAAKKQDESDNAEEYAIVYHKVAFLMDYNIDLTDV